jgi:hypothetical protein
MTLQEHHRPSLKLQTTRLVDALENYEPGPGACQPEMENNLLHHLGCPYLTPYGTIRWPDLVPEEAPVVKECIRRLIAGFVVARKDPQDPPSDAASLLAGMLRHEWQGFDLFSLPETYILAAAVLNYVQLYGPDVDLERATEPAVRAMLNAWLKPHSPWESLPLAGVIAEHMFGPVWPAIALQDGCFDEYAEYAQTFAGNMVLRDRPPFLRGLCLAQDATSDNHLPDLDLGI